MQRRAVLVHAHADVYRAGRRIGGAEHVHEDEAIVPLRVRTEVASCRFPVASSKLIGDWELAT
ncbi:MAG TPA: hypothetical protein VFU86_11290 [Terriglobales bacterium]|nr:hypothetical protein [Terriglobales bacterium]